MTNEEMTEEQLKAVCYKSKLLNKYFDTYDELKKAEAEYRKANAKKLAEESEKNERSKKIEKCYKDIVDVIEKTNKSINSLKDDCKKKVSSLESEAKKLKEDYLKDYGKYSFSYTSKNPYFFDDEEEIDTSDIEDSLFRFLFGE